MKLKIFLVSVLNIHFPFWVIYFISRAGQSWLSTISCIRLGIVCTRFPCWQFPLAHIHLHILFFFFFGICEIPFFKWIWKVIPLIVPSPQVDKSHSRKLSLSMTTRSKELQQKESLNLWGVTCPLSPGWCSHQMIAQVHPNPSGIVDVRVGLPGMLPQVSLHSNQSLHKLEQNLFGQWSLRHTEKLG